MSVKISQLPTASFITSDDYIPIVDSGTLVTQKATAEQLLDYITSSITELPNLIIETGTIGPAEDSDYTDGLFTDFNNTTTIGTAIDRFNEVLKGLAPKSAPDLTNLESITVSLPMNLSFGSSSSTSSYTNVTASLVDLTNVDIGQPFSLITGPGGNRIRLGTFANLTAINLLLNNTTVADAGTFTNYPNDAFSVAVDGSGSYALEINGTEIIPASITTTTASYSDSSFILSTADPAVFIGSGQEFDLFRHRTGSVIIPTSSWQNGHNYAKVTYTDASGIHTTNYIDWVYDPQAAVTGPAYVFSTPDSASFTLIGEKDLSGIKYYADVSYNFSCSITNYYKNCYPITANGGITFDNLVNVTPSPFVSTPIPADSDEILQRSSAHGIGNIRLLGQSLSSRINVSNGLGKTGNTTLTTLKVLLDKVNTVNTDTLENFCLENYRLDSGTYPTQISVSTAPAFSSATPLSSTDLAVYNGAVRYPTQLLNAGNIEGARTSLSIPHMIASQPDYSSATENRTYFRKFVNGVSSLANFSLVISGSNINFVPFSTALTGNNIKISIKVPDSTGWRDALTPVPGSTSGIELNDGVGCLSGAPPANIISPGGSLININLTTEGIAPSKLYIVRIEASKDWTGFLNKIQII